MTLQLSTRKPKRRETVDIEYVASGDGDDAVYETGRFPLADLKTLKVSEQAHIMRALGRFEMLTDPAVLADATDSEIDQLSTDLEATVKRVLPTLTDVVLAQLDDEARIAIVSAFAEGSPSNPTPSTSSPTSDDLPASSDSTAEAPTVG